MSDKENLSVTPKKVPVSPIVDYSPTNLKRALKPVSPNKFNNGSVGRLSFLQSDQIDDHFDYIHTSHEEIKQQLHIVEVQTKQTNVDLGELFDRLKNNNQNLNKVLLTIAEYSKEVTTEGNATKTDVTKIMSRLEQLGSKDLEHALAELLISTRERTVASLAECFAEIVRKSETRTEQRLNTSREMQVQKIEDMKAEVAKLHTSLAIDDLSGAIENMAKILNSMSSLLTTRADKNYTAVAELSQLLQKSEAKTASSIEGLSARLEDLSVGSSPDSLVSVIEKQTHAIESLRAQLSEREQTSQLHMKYETLLTKHDTLQAKYDSLCTCYETKYTDYVNLETRFSKLAQSARDLDSRINSMDTRYGKVQQLHSSRMSALMESPVEPAKKRVISMPIKAHETQMLRGILESYNSDVEF